MSRERALDIFSAGVKSVLPDVLLQKHISVNSDSLIICGHHIPKSSFGKIYVIGAGKASAAMAHALESIVGKYITAGIVTTKYGHSLATQKIEIIEAAHPVPDGNCVLATQKTIELIKDITADDLVICLLSGGASALWCDVPDGLTLEDIQHAFDLLIRSGASIHEINVVRKHLSNIKGGQLLRHCNGARAFSLIISDVPGDDLDVIASGPTVPDRSTFQDALDVLSGYGLVDQLPTVIMRYLRAGLKGDIAETPKPDDPMFNSCINSIIGSNKDALSACGSRAKELGFRIIINPGSRTGDTETEARTFVDQILSYKGDKPVCILQGGETTLKVTGSGKGGRNQHFALSALYQLTNLQRYDIPDNLVIISGGTDGTDGPTGATGGIIDKETLQLAHENQINTASYLKNHDSYHFLEQTNSLIVTGPTQTNVMDIMLAILT